MTKTFDEFADGDIQRIAATVVRLENQVRNLSQELRSLGNRNRRGVDIWEGVTGAHAGATPYPAIGTGCVFPVELSELHWAETISLCPTSTKNDLSQFIVARTIDSSYVGTGTHVVGVHVRGSHGGRYWIISAPKKVLRFTLDSVLDTSDESKPAQAGGGPVTVNNLETSTAGVYVFSGTSGAAGLAEWVTGSTYQIIQMECP